MYLPSQDLHGFDARQNQNDSPDTGNKQDDKQTGNRNNVFVIVSPHLSAGLDISPQYSFPSLTACVCLSVLPCWFSPSVSSS